jgi:hypothetical protein
MPARAAFRDREETEVAVLDALVGRADDGMTVLELRSHVDADIDQIESALTALKRDGLIRVERSEETVWIYPDDRVVPDPGESPDDERGFFDALRRRLFGGPAHDGRADDSHVGDGGRADDAGVLDRAVERLRRLFR